MQQLSERCQQVPERTRQAEGFLIHGHDEGQWRATASMLLQMGLEPVVLKTLPGRGKTIMEKFIAHARECAFAVAVFTPDDFVTVKDSSVEEYRQPRPNAIFEVGWFAGTLGRERVVVLCSV